MGLCREERGAVQEGMWTVDLRGDEDEEDNPTT